MKFKKIFITIMSVSYNSSCNVLSKCYIYDNFGNVNNDVNAKMTLLFFLQFSTVVYEVPL